MINKLERILSRLVHDCDAEAVVVWSHPGYAATGFALCAYPIGLLAPDAPLPIPVAAASATVERDPGNLATMIPTTLRVALPVPLTAAWSLELPDAGVTVLIVWTVPPANDELPEHVRRLVQDEVAHLARLLDGQRRCEAEAHRLQAVVDVLAQGVVSVNHSLDEADVNQSAALLLHLSPGKHPISDFTTAMANLQKRTTNRAELLAEAARVLIDPSITTASVWRFPKPPIHLLVSSIPLHHSVFSGRVWVFDDVSPVAKVLDASEHARALVRANADGMLDPQVLLEAIRNPERRIVDFVYRDVNPAMCAYLSKTREDLVNTSFLATQPNLESSGLFLLAHYSTCAETGEPIVLDDFPYYNEILDDWRRYDIRAARVTSDSISLSWRDVTARYEAAQRVTASEEHFRLLSENAPDVLVLIRDGGIAWISPSVEEAFGKPPAYWLGRTVGEFVPTGDAELVGKIVDEIKRGGMAVRRSHVITADGAMHWVELHVRIFHDAHGHPDGTICSVRLIDEEVAAEQLDREAPHQQTLAYARYRPWMDNSAVGMCLVTPDGHFAEVNDALCHFFGYDADTLRHKTWQELTAEEYLEADLKNVADVLSGRIDSYRMVKQYIQAGGRLIWGDLSVSCLRDSGGQVEILISQVVDITAEMEARDHLALRDKQSRILAQRLQRQSDRMTSEIDCAARYVASILPGDLDGPVQASSRYLPSWELGGDCFHYNWIDDDHLVTYLIDVSGHGIEPSLLSISVHNMLRSGSLPKATLLMPDELLAQLNKLFQMEQQGGNYFTIWYGVYQASSRTLRYASAGHPPALVFTGGVDDDLTVTKLMTNSLPVGMFDDTSFDTATYTLPPDSRVLLYSDGVWEFHPPGNETWSLAAFIDLATKVMGSSNCSLDAFIEQLRARTIDGVFDDDCSLVALRFE